MACSSLAPRLLALRACALMLAVLLAASPAAAAGPGAPAPRAPEPPGGAGDTAETALGEPAPATVPGSLMVTSTDAEAGEAAVDRAAGVGAEATRVTPEVVRVNVPAGAEEAVAAALRAVPGVVAVEPERAYAYARVPNDPRYGEQWAHGLAGAERGWDYASSVPGVRVAVLDSGMLGGHPELEANIVAQVDVSDGSTVVDRGTGVDNATCSEAADHGTQVAGIVGAVGDNAVGLTGVTWRVALLDVALNSAAHCSEGPSDGAVVRGLHYVRDQPDGVDVVNLSFGSLGEVGEACPTAVQSAIDAVRARGTVVVAAAGNVSSDELGKPMFPAACDGVIAVGAVDRDGERAAYSSTASYLDLTAPGGAAGSCQPATCVLTTTPTAERRAGYAAVAGTSYAAPYVSGAAALVRARRPELTPDKVESLLERTAWHPTRPGHHDDAHGWGVVQLTDALLYAVSGKAVPDPEPHPRPGPVVVRVANGNGVTEPITQAVAASRHAFRDGQARHALVARSDDYADALAGSALGYGVGPLLFSRRAGALAAPTRAELQRVLPAGGLVYLLGGSAALDPRLDAEIRALGYQVRRLSGKTREHTAVAVAHEVGRRLDQLGAPRNPVALLATRGNWPDAVAAGSIGAVFGVPILLTAPASLHPATAEALGALDVRTLYVVGGSGVVSDATMHAARAAAGASSAKRLGGAARDATAVAVATELEARMRGAGLGDPRSAIAVNLDRADGFAHVLSASAIAGARPSVFVPVRGTGGDLLTPVTREYVCRLSSDGLLAGDADLLATSVAGELRTLLSGSC